eukprot:2257069-Prymnesium_polylepis.1
MLNEGHCVSTTAAGAEELRPSDEEKMKQRTRALARSIRTYGILVGAAFVACWGISSMIALAQLFGDYAFPAALELVAWVLMKLNPIADVALVMAFANPTACKRMGTVAARRGRVAPVQETPSCKRSSGASCGEEAEDASGGVRVEGCPVSGARLVHPHVCGVGSGGHAACRRLVRGCEVRSNGATLRVGLPPL